MARPDDDYVEFTPNGAWPALRRELGRLPGGAVVYVVTFVVALAASVLEFFEERGLELRVIARHPRQHPPTSFPLESFELAQGSPALTALKGVVDPENNLHAKLLVAEVEGKPWPTVVTGSWNWTVASLFENAETVAVQEDAAQAGRLLAIAKELEVRGVDLTEADCIPAPGRPPRRRRRRERSPGATHWAVLDLLSAALEVMLSNYPREGERFQADILETLLERDRTVDMLWAPGGLGKSFMSIAYAVARLKELDAPRFGVFLVPRVYLTRSVLRDLALIVAFASQNAAAFDLPADPDELLALVLETIKVVRPSRSEMIPAGMVGVLVADEVQAWSPTESTRYSDAVERFRPHASYILGSSWTPCRFELGLFSVDDFASAWLGEQVQCTAPFMSLVEAVERGYLARPRHVRLLPETLDDMQTLLTCADTGELYEYGEYQKVVLRNAWRIIAKDPARLARSIRKQLQRHSSHRVLVFLPPVAAEADEFVRCLRKEIEKKCSGSFFDFRSDSAPTPAEAVRVYEAFNTASATPDRPAVLCTVERYMEGISTVDVSALVVLRASLSPKVTFQLLARGMRLFGGKELIVLDAVAFKERVEAWEPGLFQSAS